MLRNLLKLILKIDLMVKRKQQKNPRKRIRGLAMSYQWACFCSLTYSVCQRTEGLCLANVTVTLSQRGKQTVARINQETGFDRRGNAFLHAYSCITCMKDCLIGLDCLRPIQQAQFLSSISSHDSSQLGYLKSNQTMFIFVN